jgi:hypothetical protein
MITETEILMGREKEFPLTPELEVNLLDLIPRINKVRTAYGKPMTVSSGYRPGHYNSDAHGAANSPHKTCQAVDFHDSDGELKRWCLAHMDVLKDAGLFMESPDSTPTWLHLQSRPTHNNPFKP